MKDANGAPGAEENCASGWRPVAIWVAVGRWKEPRLGIRWIGCPRQRCLFAGL